MNHCMRRFAADHTWVESNSSIPHCPTRFLFSHLEIEAILWRLQEMCAKSMSMKSNKTNWMKKSKTLRQLYKFFQHNFCWNNLFRRYYSVAVLPWYGKPSTSRKAQHKVVYEWYITQMIRAHSDEQLAPKSKTTFGTSTRCKFLNQWVLVLVDWKCYATLQLDGILLMKTFETAKCGNIANLVFRPKDA